MPEKLNLLVEKAKELGCEVLENEPMSAHTTFKIGGPCKAMIVPNSAESCGKLVKTASENGVRFTVVGNGSNLLCDDKGYDSAIFHIGKSMQQIKLVGENMIYAEAGASLAKLCLFACENELTGLEFAYGIPGTVGGAVYMNAGAYGGEIKDVIVSAEAVDKNGNKVTFENADMKLSYRKSAFQNDEYIITSALFKLEKGDRNAISAKMSELMARRKEKQPLEYPNAGSTFKRPEGQFAGKLIQDCGLRGFTVGGAQVSEKHCGFVINKNEATFSDVVSLIEQVQEKVRRETGYFLECEVKILKSE